jgi:hypothetical protein
MRKQLKILEHHADPGTQCRQVRAGRAHRDAVDDDFALLEWFESIDGLDQRRFARTGWPANHHHIAFGNTSVAIGQNLKLAIPFAEIFYRDHIYCGTCLMFHQLTKPTLAGSYPHIEGK